MADGIRWVGLDVHATQTAGAVFDTATGEVRSRRIAGRPHEALEWLTELPGRCARSMRRVRWAMGSRAGRERRGSTCRCARRG